MKTGDLIELEMGWLSNGHREIVIAVVTGVDPSDDECEIMFYRYGKQRYSWIPKRYAKKRRLK